MKAIRVRHLPPTSKLPRRVKADDNDGNSFTLHLCESDQFEGSYRRAAAALCANMKWLGRLIEGQYGHDHFFVFDPLFPTADPASTSGLIADFV